MLDMPLLTTVGALIGCSGAALTKIMCDAMNRDIVSVILGGYGTKSSGGGEAMKFEGEATTTDVDSVIKLLDEAESVIIVPGYGLAVSFSNSLVLDCNESATRVLSLSTLICLRLPLPSLQILHS